MPIASGGGWIDHELVALLVDDHKPITDHMIASTEAARKRDKAAAKPILKLTPSEHYAHVAFTAVMTLHDSFDRLVQARAFMKGFPQPRQYEAEGISAVQWLDYHYAVHRIVAVAVADQALILTNEVLELGNPLRNCTRQVVQENRKVKGTPTAVALKRLMKVVEPVRDDRNASAHHGRMTAVSTKYNSEDLALVSLYGAPFLRARLPKGKRVSHSKLAVLYKAGVEGVLPSLKQFEEELVQAVTGLFEALLLPYKSRKLHLKLLELAPRKS